MKNVVKRAVWCGVVLGFLVAVAGCDKKPKENTLQNTVWKTDNLFCLDEDIDVYNLTQKTGSQELEWGSFVQFSKKGTFISYDKPRCGSGCTYAVYGKYNTISDTKLSATVDSVYSSCWYLGNNWTEYRNGKPIYFTISKEENNMVLVLCE